MRNQILLLGLWTLLELFASCYAHYGDFAFPHDPSIVYTYSRSAEIENHCSQFLSSASELKPDDSRGKNLKNELSFYHGDWDQEYTGAPLMPFNDRDMPGGGPPFVSPWKVVSFEVTDVNSVHQSKTSVKLSGVLSIGITRNSTFLKEPISTFIMRPGLSALRVNLEGVYFETEENGGERVVCLLGNTTLPSRKFFDDSTDMMENYFDVAYDIDPVISKSDQILILLRYPRTFNISSRGIRGEMTSLSKDDFSIYFDKVHISSQLGSFSKYHFSSRNLSSRSCDTSPLHNEMLEDGAVIFGSCEFCRILKRFQGEAYHIMPNWKLGGKYNHHRNEFGPFLLSKEIKAAGLSYKNMWISMQHVICEEEASQGETKIARVSAVLRLSPATIEAYVAARRTGLSELTLSVEGTWNSSLGQLCMVGCRGPNLAQCDTQIIMYLPRSISINQKNLLIGSISSFKNEIDSYTPILFGFRMYSDSVLFRHNWYIRSYLSYNYTKIEHAIAFRERSQPGALAATVKQSLLRYPSLGEGASLLDRLDSFSSDLRFRAVVGPETSVQIEVLSIGPLLGPLDLPGYSNNTLVGTLPDISKSDSLNISLTLLFTEVPVKVKDECYYHVSKLKLEGIYVPSVGTLYLVGCRNVSMEGVYIEGGLDCLMEVKVEYSSETTRWLINPTAKITIASQRNGTDPLYFTPITLRVFRIHDRSHGESVNLRKIFEGGLRVVLLFVSVALIWSQLCYMKKKPDLVPYVSLVMLCIQLFGYSSSLISDKEILIKSRETKYYRERMYNLRNYELFVKGPCNTDKLLVLAALVLTARVFQLVLRARAALRAQGGSRFGDVPSEVRVLLISLVVLAVFSPFSLINYWYLIPPGEDFVAKVVFMISKFADQVCSSSVKSLAPQLIATYLSKARVNPLRKAYFIGFLSISLIQNFYDRIQELR